MSEYLAPRARFFTTSSKLKQKPMRMHFVGTVENSQKFAGTKWILNQENSTKMAVNIAILTLACSLPPLQLIGNF